MYVGIANFVLSLSSQHTKNVKDNIDHKCLNLCIFMPNLLSAELTARNETHSVFIKYAISWHWHQLTQVKSTNKLGAGLWIFPTKNNWIWKFRIISTNSRLTNNFTFYTNRKRNFNRFYIFSKSIDLCMFAISGQKLMVRYDGQQVSADKKKKNDYNK